MDLLKLIGVSMNKNYILALLITLSSNSIFAQGTFPFDMMLKEGKKTNANKNQGGGNWCVRVNPIKSNIQIGAISGQRGAYPHGPETTTFTWSVQEWRGTAGSRFQGNITCGIRGSNNISSTTSYRAECYRC